MHGVRQLGLWRGQRVCWSAFARLLEHLWISRKPVARDEARSEGDGGAYELYPKEEGKGLDRCLPP
jgi:hypothetical protein